MGHGFHSCVEFTREQLGHVQLVIQSSTIQKKNINWMVLMFAHIHIARKSAVYFWTLTILDTLPNPIECLQRICIYPFAAKKLSTKLLNYPSRVNPANIFKTCFNGRMVCDWVHYLTGGSCRSPHVPLTSSELQNKFGLENQQPKWATGVGQFTQKPGFSRNENIGLPENWSCYLQITAILTEKLWP